MPAHTLIIATSLRDLRTDPDKKYKKVKKDLRSLSEKRADRCAYCGWPLDEKEMAKIIMIKGYRCCWECQEERNLKSRKVI